MAIIASEWAEAVKTHVLCGCEYEAKNVLNQMLDMLEEASKVAAMFEHSRPEVREFVHNWAQIYA